MLLRRYFQAKPSIPLAIGQISLVLSILLQRFFVKPEISATMMPLYQGLAGFFLGLSLVFNVAGLILLRRKGN